MALTIKKTIVGCGLLVMLVWPLVHHVLVRTTPLSAWKGAGWSMYCEPNPAIGVVIAVPGQPGWAPPVDQLSTRQQDEFGRALATFQARRAHLGTWAEPKDYAQVMFRLFPTIDHLQITVAQAMIDRATAKTVVEREDRYEYRRDDP